MFTGCEALRGPRSATDAPWNDVQVHEGVARGGQPAPDKPAWIAERGVKMIVDLRQYVQRPVRELVQAEALGMQ